jgi:hypothetical protein
MSFEDTQRDYYTHEINRTLPTRGGPQDLETLNAALRITDPVMPTAGVRQLSDAQNLISSFGLQSDALQRDAACRKMAYPGRAPTSRADCGWWFVDDQTIPSSGAHGTRRGPMSPLLDKHVGPGRWIWDPKEAYKQESMKRASSIRACPDIQFSTIPDIGWCPVTNRAIVTDGNGNPAYPLAMGGDCPGGGIVMKAESCPPPPAPGDPGFNPDSLSASTTALCQPQGDGSLSPACLQNLAGYYCSSTGSLASSLQGGYAGTSDTFNSSNYYLPPNLIHPGFINNGQVGVGSALQSVYQLRMASNAGDSSRATQAARNLCSGTAFDPCALSPTDMAPFNPLCIARACIAAGYSADGELLPAKAGMDYWNALYGRPSTWADVQGNIAWYKNVADQMPGYTTGPTEQTNAIRAVYGVSVKWPTKGCNYNGLFMYRYLGYPAGISLFPATGGVTHFLGRYILKNGIPSQGQALSFDQTPAGGFNMENQRLVANFVPQVGGTYQFLISSSCTTRITLKDINVAFPPSQGSATPITTLIAQKPYPITLDIINSSGVFAFGIAMTVNGAPWTAIPASQLFMLVDRRVPMIEMAFNKMPADPTGTAPSKAAVQTDTAGLFQNLSRYNAPIGQLNGRTCMLVNGGGKNSGSAVFSHAKLVQGIRFCAMKSFTLMVNITKVAATGVTPSLIDFWNPASSNPQGPVHGFSENQNTSYFTRKNDFMLTANSTTIYPYGLDPTKPMAQSFNANVGTGAVAPYKTGVWTHVAMVWNDDFAGYTLYTTTGSEMSPTTTVATGFVPAYSPTLIMEHMVIGSNNSPDNCYWTGGIAWFRAFDYRLTQEQVLIDFKDQWGNI